MSLNSIISSAVSGMSTAQLGLNTVSDNVANLNTPGYSARWSIRTPCARTARHGGFGPRASSWRPTSSCRTPACRLRPGPARPARLQPARPGARAFGDPSSSTSYFNQLNRCSPTSAPRPTIRPRSLRAPRWSTTSTFLNQSQSIASILRPAQHPGRQPDHQRRRPGQPAAVADRRPEHPHRQRHQPAARDATGSQDSQSELIDPARSLMDVKAQPNIDRRGALTTQGGAPLVGAGRCGDARLYALRDRRESVTITQPGGGAAAGQLAAGQRRDAGPAVAAQHQPSRRPGAAREYVSGAVNAINAAHNANAAVPPPQTLTGQQHRPRPAHHRRRLHRHDQYRRRQLQRRPAAAGRRSTSPPTP